MRLDLDLVDRYGDRISRIALYGSLAVIYAWFGGMKFTSYEANGIEGFVKYSPFLSWFYAFLSVQGFSNFLGVLEISVGALIAARLLHPILSLVGGTLSCGLFLTTLSFLATTPGVSVVELGFLPYLLFRASSFSRTWGFLRSRSGSRSTRSRLSSLGETAASGCSLRAPHVQMATGISACPRRMPGEARSVRLASSVVVAAVRLGRSGAAATYSAPAVNRRGYVLRPTHIPS
jgi:uncharacterized membrane protein YkgB